MYSYRSIWNISNPILISLFVQNIISVTDTAFLGRVGEVELGASALSSIFYLAIYMIGFGFSIGSQIMMSRRNGEKNYKGLGPIMQQGSLFLLFLAAVMYLTTITTAPIFLKTIISSEPVYTAALEYLNYRSIGLFFSFMNIMFRAFFVSIAKTRVLTGNAIIMSLCNVLLNYILIFGKWGAPALGIGGAAIASVISEAVSLVCFIIYMRMRVDIKKYDLLFFKNFDFRIIVRILNLSIWTMIQNFLTIFTWFFFFVAVEHLGERELAISNIVRSISNMLFMPVSAFATTASSFAGNAMGSKKYETIMPGTRRIIKMCIVILLPFVLMIFICPDPILRIFTDNTQLINDSIPSLWILTCCYSFAAPGGILFQTLSGTGNTRSALAIEFCTLIFYCTFIYIAIYKFRVSVEFCWISEFIYWLFMSLGSYIYLKKASWQTKKV